MVAERLTGTALVTGARSPAALDIARDLVSSGMKVHMADSVPARISRWSRAPVQVHRIRPPVQDPAGFRADIAALVRALSPTIVIPTCEEVFHLAAARDANVDVGPLFAPDGATLDLLHAKDSFNAFVLGLGLDAPATRLHTVDVDPDGMDLPRTVLKACYSRFGAGTLIAPAAGQVAAIRPTASHPWISQARIDGVEHSSYAIAVRGRVTGFAAYHSTLRLGGGAGYAFRTAAEAVHRRMLDATRAIVEKLSLTGQISLDAIDDGKRCWLIECNPRATSGVHLLSGTGAIARALAGTAGTETCGQGARHNLPMILTHGLTRLARRGPRDDFRQGRDVIGAPGDRLPILGAIVDTLQFAVEASRHRTTLTGATTVDIEWNGNR